MNHTPGPWNVHYTKAATRIHANDDHGDVAVVPVRYSKTDNLTENAANAALIAAAPDGYAANILALRILEFTFRDEGPEAAQQAISALRAAIAKAEGRA